MIDTLFSETSWANVLCQLGHYFIFCIKQLALFLKVLSLLVALFPATRRCLLSCPSRLLVSSVCTISVTYSIVIIIVWYHLFLVVCIGYAYTTTKCKTHK